VGVKAEQTAEETPVRQKEYLQKVEKQEIREIQVTRGLFADVKIKDKDS
jgi:hypothetical protein